jgi:hypothetical protein
MHKKGRRTIVERNKSIELFACITPVHVLSIGDDIYQSDPLNPIQRLKVDVIEAQAYLQLHCSPAETIRDHTDVVQSLKESTKQRARASAVFPEPTDLE